MEELVRVKTEESKGARWVDRLGVSVSAACLVHCLALPLMLAVAPGLGVAIWIGDGLEQIFAILAVLLAVGSLCWGFRIHRKRRLFFVFGLAVAFFLTGQFYAEGWAENVLIIGGAAGLVASHLLNRYLCRSCGTCEEDACGSD